MSDQRPNTQAREGSALPRCSISPVADTATPGRAPWSIRTSTPSQAWMMPPNTSLPNQIGDPIAYLSPLTKDPHGVCRNRRQLSLSCSAVPYTIHGERPGHWSQAPMHGPLATHYGKLPPTPLGQFYGYPSSQPVPTLQLVPIHPPAQGQSQLSTFQDGTSFNFYNHATLAPIPLAERATPTQNVPVPTTSGNHVVLVLREAEAQTIGAYAPTNGSSTTGPNAEDIRTSQVSSASTAAKEFQYHLGDPAQATTEHILRGSCFQPLKMLKKRGPIAPTVPVATLPGNHMISVPREVELHTIPSSASSSGLLSSELVAGNLKTCKGATSITESLHRVHAQARVEDNPRSSFFRPVESLEEKGPMAQTVRALLGPGNHTVSVLRETESQTIRASDRSSWPLVSETGVGNPKTCKASSSSFLARTSKDFLGNPTAPQSEHKMKSSHQELEMLTEPQPIPACPPVFSADSSSPEAIQITEHLAPQGGDVQVGIMSEARLQPPSQDGTLMIGLGEFPDFEELMSSMEPLLPDCLFPSVDPSEPSEWITKECAEGEAVETVVLSRGMMGAQSLDVVGFSHIPKRVISEETSLCPPSAPHISPIIDLIDLTEEPQKLNKVSGIPIKSKLLSPKCLSEKKIPRRSDESQPSKERSTPTQAEVKISTGSSNPKVSSNRKRKNIPSNKQEPLTKIPKTNIISDLTTIGQEVALETKGKEGSADNMDKKGGNQMPTKLAKYSSQKEVTDALKITMRNLEAKKTLASSKASSEVSPVKGKLPAVEGQKEVDPGSSSCKSKGLKTKAKDPKPEKKQPPPQGPEKASMHLPGTTRGKKKAAKAAAEVPPKPIPRSHLALQMMETVNVFHPLGVGKLPPAPIKKQLPLVTSAPVKPLQGMGTLGRPMPSLPRIPKLSVSSSGSLLQPQSSSKPVPSSGPIPLQRPAVNPSVLSRSYDQKPSSSQLYQASGWRPQAIPARKPTGPIPHPPMVRHKQWRPCSTQASTVVVRHLVEPPASPPYKGDTFIPWRTPPDDLEVSDPITEEQRPTREMMKRQAQREREEAAHWTSVGRVKYFVEREKEMDISVAYGYPWCY